MSLWSDQAPEWILAQSGLQNNILAQKIERKDGREGGKEHIAKLLVGRNWTEDTIQ